LEYACAEVRFPSSMRNSAPKKAGGWKEIMSNRNEITKGSRRFPDEGREGGLRISGAVPERPLRIKKREDERRRGRRKRETAIL